MNALTRIAANAAVFATLSLTIAGTTKADEVTGTVLAFDRVARVLVLTDKTVFPLEVATGDLPESLSAGDKVVVKFEGDEDGVRAISSINILTEDDDS